MVPALLNRSLHHTPSPSYCSHFIPLDAKGKDGRLPCVIYCHCNSGSRRDAEEAVRIRGGNRGGRRERRGEAVWIQEKGGGSGAGMCGAAPHWAKGAGETAVRGGQGNGRPPRGRLVRHVPPAVPAMSL